MIGFILAAGFGTRLLPLTDHIPKALVPVCGIPLLKRAHDFFTAGGITRIGVNAHHHPEQIGQFVRSSFPDVRMFHERGSIRGTGGAVDFAREFLGSDEAFCVANVDILTNADLANLAQRFLQSSSSVGLVAAPAQNGTIRFSIATGEFAGTRSQRENTPDDKQKYGSADFIGITFYRKEFLSVLRDTDFNIIPVWIRAREAGMKVAVLGTGPVYWKDVGTFGNLAKIHFDVLDRTVELAPPDSMVVDYAEKRAYPKLFGQPILRHLGPYTWIDAMTRIPDESTFSKAVVFTDAVVPDGVSIENAIVTKYGVMSFEP